MKVLSKEPVTERRITGRLSDGSDRQVIAVTDWFLLIEQGDRFFSMMFDHDPPDTEVQQALDAGHGQEIVAVEHLSTRLAATRAELFTTLEAAAYLYEENLQLHDANLMSLEAIAALYEMLTGGEPQ